MKEMQDFKCKESYTDEDLLIIGIFLLSTAGFFGFGAAFAYYASLHETAKTVGFGAVALGLATTSVSSSLMFWRNGMKLQKQLDENSGLVENDIFNDLRTDSHV